MKTGAILVSGGSKGLGLEIVRHLLEAGHPVGTFARSRGESIAKLEKRFPSQLAFAELDARDETGVSRFLSDLLGRFGTLRGLVNNAAIGQDSLLAHTAPETIAEIVAVNLLAPILLSRLVVKKMLLQEAGGRIVTISSVCAQHGYSGLAVYAATKAALEGFTRSLAREVGARNIQVNAIAPGFFESEMSSVLAVEQVEAIRRRTPTGRLTVPSDLLPVLDQLLFSEVNMTGQVLPIDGGAAY